MTKQGLGRCSYNLNDSSNIIFSKLEISDRVFQIFICVVPCIFIIIILYIQKMHTLYYVKHFIGLPTCFDPEGSSSGHLIH
jgi:hypothetical protein